MKAKWYLSLCLAVMALVGCSQDEMFNEQKQGATTTLTATMEGQEGSRTLVDNNGVFTWTTGDALSVWNGESFTTFTLTSGNTFTAENNQTITPNRYAIYPADTSHKIENGTLKVNLPTTYGSVNKEHNENTHLPMLAKIDPNNPTNLSFKHLGGLMCFVVKNVPAGVDGFQLDMEHYKINGTHTVETLNGEDYIKCYGSTNEDYRKRVKISFKSWNSGSKDMKFYVPLPVGEYDKGYTVSLLNSDDENFKAMYMSTGTNVAKNTIKRGTLLLMPTFTYDDTYSENGVANHLKKVTSNEIALESGEQTFTVTGDEESIVVNPDNATDAVLDLNFTPTDANSTLTISDGSDDNAASTESEATVNVNAGNATVGALTINAPSLTVNLASGTYTSVTAKTATNTLVVGSGVTVQALEVKGGNVIIKSGATVSAITHETNAGKIFVLYESGATVPTNITDENVVVLPVNAEGDVEVGTFDALKKAVGCPATIKLTADIQGTEAICLGSDVTINGNNHTITSSATRVFRLTASNIKVAMENLTVASTAEQSGTNDVRGISVDPNYTEVELSLNGCTVTFADEAEDDYAYAVNVADGSKHTINITGGSYEGANVINVWGSDHTVTIDGATLASKYKVSEKYYGSCVCLEGIGVNLTVKNAKLEGAHAVAVDEKQVGKNTITASDNTNNVKCYVAKVGSTYYYSLNEAATATGDIILFNNTALAADLTISTAICVPTGVTATINLGSYDVTATQSDAFEVQGTLVINAEDDAEIKAGTVTENTGSVCAVWAHNGGKVTINGGHYIVYEDKNGDRNDCIYAGSNAKGTAGTITINGGKFEYGSDTGTENAKNGHLFLLNCADSQPTSSITVNGGLFKNHVPSMEANGTDEVALGSGKAVYKQNGSEKVTTAHSGTEDVWYEVK